MSSAVYDSARQLRGDIVRHTRRDIVKTLAALPLIRLNRAEPDVVGDLSSASFKGAAVTGNGHLNISCNSATAVTRGALTAAGGPANTNCTN